MRMFVSSTVAMMLLVLLVPGIQSMAQVIPVEWGQVLLDTQDLDTLEGQLIKATALVNLGELGTAFDQIEEIRQKENYLEFAEQMQVKYQAFLQQDPQNLLSLNVLGLVEWALADYVQAGNHFRRIIELEPKNVWIRLFLGITLWNQGESQVALTELKAAHELDKTNQYAHCLLSAAYFELNDYMRAVYHYLKCPDVRKEMSRRGF
jgi:tetratricopeptide (TPR) repeat protein